MKRNGEDGAIGYTLYTEVLRKCPILLDAVARFSIYEHAGKLRNRGLAAFLLSFGGVRTFWYSKGK